MGEFLFILGGIIFISGIIAIMALCIFALTSYFEKTKIGLKKTIKIIGAIIAGAVIIMIAGLNAEYRAESNVDKERYVKTGEMLIWEDLYTSFSYQGVRYIELDLSDADGFWQDYYVRDSISDIKPAFNIRQRLVLSSLFYGTGKDTMFEVESGAGVKLYTDTLAVRYYCAADDEQILAEYYNDDSDAELNLKIFIYDEDGNKYCAEVIGVNSRECNDIRNMNTISYESNGVENYGELTSVSSDGIMERIASVVLIDGKWYRDSYETDKNKSTEDKEFYYAYELPENIEKQLPHDFK